MGIIDNVYPDGVPVAKADVRADDKTGHRRSMADVNAVQNTDLSGQYAGIYVRELQTAYDIDTADATTAHDGLACLRDWVGNCFKVSAASAAVSAFDYLINGSGQVDQRATSSLTDATYGHDRWYALTQTAAIAKSSLANVADGLPSMMRLTQSQASAQRFGYAQVIEASRCKRLRGKLATFGGKLRYSNAAAIRYAILEWTGAADVVIKDVVNNWTNSTFTGGQFFNSTTLTVRQVGAITPSAATLTDFALSATLGSSLNNLILFVWTEGASALNSTLDIAASLKYGASVAPLIHRPYGDEYSLCRRYYRVVSPEGAGMAANPVVCFFNIRHPGMRSAPSVSLTSALIITNIASANYTQSSAQVSINGTNTADQGLYSFGNFTGLTGTLPYLEQTGQPRVILNSEL